MKWLSRQKKNNISDNRIKVLTAIIFLFAGGIMVKLFNIQVMGYDLYSARAMQQHGVEKEIMPRRGRIFVRTQEGKSGLYPLAANKEFALVYAVPKDILNSEQAVDTLAPVLYPLVYEEPDVEELMAKIESRLREEMAKESSPAAGEEIAIDEEQLAIALEKEKIVLLETLKKEKEEKMKEYKNELLGKLSKKNDPYEPLVKKVDKDKLKEIISLEVKGIDYFMSDYRYYPENNISGHILGYVIENPDSVITQGSYGLEGFFNKDLAGIAGKVKAERDAVGQIIIAADRKINPAVNGSDLILTIDKTIQNVACRKLNIATLRHGADLGAVIIVNPKTGAVIAMCGYPDFNPNEYGETKNLEFFNNVGIYNAYEPGSVYKVMTMAMGIDLELIEPDSTFNDPGAITIATETIKNAENKVYGMTDMNGVLENSINTGAIFVAQKVGINNFIKYTEDFGFGQKTGMELKTESAGNISSLYDKMHGDNLNLAVASFGQSITATPLQLLMAYAAVVNEGILVKPYIVDEIVRPDGHRVKNQPQEIRRVISPRAAALVSGMMVNIVERGHSKRAKVSGYYVGAKTGTAQIASLTSRGYSGRTNHTLIGMAPAGDPKFVMLTYFEDPKDARYAESTAAPLFSEIAEFMLNYYQVEKER